MNKEKTLNCGCVEDSLNNAIISFCATHKEQYDRWLERKI